MSFTWPFALLLLLAVPLVLGVHVLQQRRRRRNAVRFSNVALVRAAVGTRRGWRRHIPLGLFLGALVALAVASARPSVAMDVSRSRTTIVLALDVSRSMCATDVEPNRLTVAQEAARRFVKDQPAGARIGIVAFAGFAELVVPPTTDTDQLLEAIDNLTTARGTVIGAATLKAIDAIAAINPAVEPVGDEVDDATGGFTPPGQSADVGPITKPTGPFVPDVVVLLTDGANTRGISPIDAAKIAAERSVRVYTIGFGTENPTAMVCTREQLGAGGFGGGFGGGGNQPFDVGGGASGAPRQFLVIDEPTLQAVADLTGGTFARAENAEQLTHVFDELPTQIETQEEQREISALFAAAGAVLAIAAIGLSMWWTAPRRPTAVASVPPAAR